MNAWKNCRNILCIRADNMGDVLMSSPAIGALRASIGCKITLLTSGKGAVVTSLLPVIDEVIEFDVPWIRSDKNEAEIFPLIDLLKERAFDACVIFTVYSQNPMPAIMLAYLAKIPLRLAYCRENPYKLLTHWVPDPEPYELIRHQVERDLDLVGHVGAFAADKRIKLSLPFSAQMSLLMKLNIDTDLPYLVLHPGVSEVKRTYGFNNWVLCGKLLAGLSMPLLITGSAEESELVQRIAKAIGHGAIALAGELTIEEFAMVISKASAVVSVNTGTVHLAAAFSTPVVVLHAMTNPQHTPWMVPCKVLPYNVEKSYKSKNKIIEHVDRIYKTELPQPDAVTVFEAVSALLKPEKQGC